MLSPSFTMAAIGQPCAHCSANKPKTVLLRANKVREKPGLPTHDKTRR